ncbi:MAG: C-GCAxxG-C-C family protein [Bacillota bacterium]|nr:C-GCAxxG-C-C family protein [Bacillota bacterium]
MYKEKALKYFNEGCNCAQSVFAAFATEYGMDEKEAMRLASSFGGGMGQMREVCGAMSGALMALGLIEGYDDFDPNKKINHYQNVRAIADKFKEKNESIICRELLSKAGDNKTPTGHNQACVDFVCNACDILQEHLNEK